MYSTRNFNTLLTVIFVFLLFGSSDLFAQNASHTVQKGETLYRISIQYSTTVDAILQLNPGITPETLQEGQTLRLPNKQTVATTQKHIAVILPLESAGVEGSRCVEFYRGLLMAADALCTQGQRIQINTYTETAQNSSIEQAINSLNNTKPDLIIGPVYPSHFARLAQYAKESNIPLYIPFSSKVEEVATHKSVNLINTPTSYKNKLLAQLILTLFKDYRFAFLHYPQAEDAELANELKKLLRADKKVFTEFNADAPITQMVSATSKTKATLIIPDSSTPEHIKEAISKNIQIHNSYPQRAVALIGLPTWDEKIKAIETKDLYAADVFIPSSSFYNATDKQTVAIEQQYRQHFKSNLLTTTPRMALLGYDLGIALLASDTERAQYQPLQTNIAFTPVSASGGKVLNCLYLLHYKPNNQVDLISPKVDLAL
ncbi:MAG: LysM peptidoglycan-binding domain-containing protein [Alloprevotella sp.]|nr:LysM peptidoglycan-binding domain-containing protein [Alloprevotella sp.]